MPPPTGCRVDLGIKLAHLNDIVLQKMFVQGVRDLQLTDERECRDVHTIVGDLDQLTLEESDVGFGAITLPHLDGEEVMVILLGLPVRCVLGEECFGYFFEVAERV